MGRSIARRRFSCYLTGNTGIVLCATTFRATLHQKCTTHEITSLRAHQQLLNRKVNYHTRCDFTALKAVKHLIDS